MKNPISLKLLLERTDRLGGMERLEDVEKDGRQDKTRKKACTNTKFSPTPQQQQKRMKMMVTMNKKKNYSSKRTAFPLPLPLRFFLFGDFVVPDEMDTRPTMFSLLFTRGYWFWSTALVGRSPDGLFTGGWVHGWSLAK